MCLPFPIHPLLLIQPPLIAGNFLENVSDNCHQAWIGKFINRTGNSVLRECVCVVCAGRFKDIDTEWVRIHDLEQKKLLLPSWPHVTHILTNGMLLHHPVDSKQVVMDSDGFPMADVCNICIGSLRRNKTLPLALSNNMWIGEVPLQLKVLTLLERILVARFFPAAYIVKLFPKKKGAWFWTDTKLHCSLRGNISMYRLNTDNITSMVDDNVLPAPMSILAAIIGVTFVGPKNILQKMMPGFLHVNQNHVWHALTWLKVNNPVYRDVHISSAHLDTLPANDVPNKILSLVHHSEDTNMLATEHNNYVPENVGQTQGTYRIGHAPAMLVTFFAEYASGFGGIIDIDDKDGENDNGPLYENVNGLLLMRVSLSPRNLFCR